MRRLFAITTSVLILLALFAPAAFAAGPDLFSISIAFSIRNLNPFSLTEIRSIPA